MDEEIFKPSSRLKNKLYLDFLNGEFVDFIRDEDIDLAMKNIDKRTRHKKEGKALLALLYYTGARPAEVLELRRKHVKRVSSSLYIQLKTKKGGKPRTLGIPISKPFAKYIWDYAKLVFPTFLLFPHYICRYKRKVITKTGKEREYMEISAVVRYHFNRWFTHIKLTPYFLRHNRFNIMMDKGFSIEGIKEAKGAKTLSSVDPYIRFSKKSADNFGRKL